LKRINIILMPDTPNQLESFKICQAVKLADIIDVMKNDCYSFFCINGAKNCIHEYIHKLNIPTKLSSFQYNRQ